MSYDQIVRRMRNNPREIGLEPAVSTYANLCYRPVILIYIQREQIEHHRPPPLGLGFPRSVYR